MLFKQFFHRFFIDLSIQNKLRAISVVTGIAILTISSTVLIANEIISLKRNMSTDLLILADIVGRNTAAGLIFENPSSVEETLLSLSAKKNITTAHVFMPEGELFAEYHREDIDYKEFSTIRERFDKQFLNDEYLKVFEKKGELAHFTANRLIVFKHINNDGVPIGIVNIESDLLELNDRLYWYLSILFVGMVLSLGLALALAAGLQAMFTRPIYGLLDVITTVTMNNNYAIRAQMYGKDEIGRLIDGFNRMLSTIERRDEQINTLNKQLNSENIRMSSELDVTKRMQQMVLPSQSELNQIDGLQIAGFMQPADEVGGDYYDVLKEGDHIKIGIGDVTGHGLESGVIMLMVQTVVRALLLTGVRDATDFLDIVNRTIYANVCRMDSDKNLTLSLLDYSDGTLLVTGQHEGVLVVRKDGRIEWIDTFELGFMVGVEPDIRRLISTTEIYLDPGDGIVLYTDGITEAHNVKAKQPMYSEVRLRETIAKNWHKTVEGVRDAVITDVLEYAGSENIFDDLTLLVIRRV